MAEMNRLGWCLTVILFLGLSGVGMVTHAESASARYFGIQVIDQESRRGVPLVTLETVSKVRYVTDSNGWVAFLEPGLMNRKVFFGVSSHGYEFPKDGFGSRGKVLETIPGEVAVIEIERRNIAQRLYRVTGEGIYGHYSRVKSLGEQYEHGVVAFDITTRTFETAQRFADDAMLYPRGQALAYERGLSTHIYFCRPFPSVRVRADSDAIQSEIEYESFTCLQPLKRYDKGNPAVEYDSSGQVVWGWKRHTVFTGEGGGVE